MLILFTVWGIYILLPYLYSRVVPWLSSKFRRNKRNANMNHSPMHSPRIVRSLPRGRDNVALTFDDGPDPIYTPMLLDLLAVYHIRATFFVVGERALKQPELIQRMAEEGHEIGVHNYQHWSNWLLPPWSTSRQIAHTATIIHERTGKWPIHYRPPWGLLNIFDIFRSHVQYVLWSVMVNDWRARASTVDTIQRRLSQQVVDGAIVLLHDCGRTIGARRNAPMFMLQALSEWLKNSKDKWSFVTVQEGLAAADELEDSKRVVYTHATHTRATPSNNAASLQHRIHTLLASLWLAWDRAVLRLLRIQPVHPQHPFLQVRIRAYTGKHTLHLNDGTVVQQGDHIAEIHLNNRMIYTIGQSSPSIMQMMVTLLRLFQPALSQLAAYLRRHPMGAQVKAVYGISLLHQPAERFGFTVLDVHNLLFSRISSWYLRFVLRLLRPGAVQQRHQPDRRSEPNRLRRENGARNSRKPASSPQDRRADERWKPKIIVISTSKLYRMYPVDSSDAG